MSSPKGKNTKGKNLTTYQNVIEVPDEADEEGYTSPIVAPKGPSRHASGLLMDQVRYHKAVMAKRGENDALTTPARGVRLLNPAEKIKDDALAVKVVAYYNIDPDDVTSVTVYPDIVIVVANATVTVRRKGRNVTENITTKKVFHIQSPAGWAPEAPDWYLYK